MAGLALKPIGGGKGRKALDEIDQSVIDTIEEAVVYFADNGGRLETEAFTSREVAEDWLSDARAYAYHRPTGRVVVSGNAAKVPGAAKDGPHVARFSVAPYVAPATEDADGAASS